MATNNQQPTARGAKAPRVALRQRVAALVKLLGEREAAKALGLNRQSVARLMAGLPCLGLTIAHAERTIEVAEAGAGGAK